MAPLTFLNMKVDERPHRNGWAPGQYTCSCGECGEPFWGEKRARECAECAYSDWQPTHRHGKTGGLYRLLPLQATIEKTVEAAVLYEAQDGRIWIRPSAEFYDGRFAEIDKD